MLARLQDIYIANKYEENMLNTPYRFLLCLNYPSLPHPTAVLEGWRWLDSLPDQCQLILWLTVIPTYTPYINTIIQRRSCLHSTVYYSSLHFRIRQFIKGFLCVPEPPDYNPDSVLMTWGIDIFAWMKYKLKSDLSKLNTKLDITLNSIEDSTWL